MPRKFSESEVDKIQDTLTSIVDSFIRNGYSPESVAEGFIREGYCVRDAIDEKSKRSKHHGRDSGYSSSYPSYGHDSGYSSHDSSHKGPRVTARMSIAQEATLVTTRTTLMARTTPHTRALAVTARMNSAHEATLIALTLHHHHLVQSLRKIFTRC